MSKAKDILDLIEGKKFIVTLTQVASSYSQKSDKIIEQKSFDDEKSAKKFIKQMIKKYDLQRQKGFWGNPKTSIELTTNF